GWAYVTEEEAAPKKDLGYNSLDELDDEDEASSSGGEWDGGDDDDADDNILDADDEEDGVSEQDDLDGEPKEKKSLVIVLQYGKKPRSSIGANGLAASTEQDLPPTPQLPSQAQAVSSPMPQRSSVKLEEPIAPSTNSNRHVVPLPPTSYTSSSASPQQPKPEQAQLMANGTSHIPKSQPPPQASSGLKATSAAATVIPPPGSTAAPSSHGLPPYPYEAPEPQNSTAAIVKDLEPATAGYQNPYAQATAPAKPVYAPVSST
ncbi:hypothetical protein LTS18_009439, partial [Coniosporium uncinatum]